MELTTHSLLAMVLAGGIATYIWRFAGTLAVQALDPGGDMMLWVRAVAIAIVAALCTKLALAPPDIVADTHLVSRLSSMAAGVLGYYAFRMPGMGVICAMAVLIGLELLL
ncbi:MAG: AzlD domain-containing protein [Hyphomicrobiales bacterium]